MDILPYRFEDAERLRYGSYPVLDTVIYRWARLVEERLFEHTRVEVYAGASVVEAMKFSAFHATIRHPRPIYFFGLPPLEGTGLLVVDNRLAAFCLRSETAGEAMPRLTPENQRALQAVVQELLRAFETCWADVHPVRSELRRVTTYPFRARVLNPYEPCLVAQVHLSGRELSSRLTWCFPRPMLEPLLSRLRGGRVLPPATLPGRHGGAPLSEAAYLGQTRFRLTAQAGTVNPRRLMGRLQPGQVLPLDAPSDGAAVVAVEGRPAALGEVGTTDGRYALRLQRPYVAEERPETPPEAFRPIRWPRA